MKRLLWSVATALLLAAPAAFAAEGYVGVNTNLRAGPDVQYPLIFTLPAGAPVSVQGCIDGYAWCDVIANGERGWIVGNYIQYLYQDQPVLLPSYGARIGVPIIAFSIGAYWGSYYSHRSFYDRRDYWYHRPPPHRPPPPPPRHPVRPPGHRPPGNRPPDHRPPGNRPPDNRPPGNRPPASRPAEQRPPSAGGPPSGNRPPSGSQGNHRPPGDQHKNQSGKPHQH